MTKYVALLRGINFGGNNKIEMSRLKIVFESIGFVNVSTYLNSGNVVFSDKSESVKKITEKIEEEIFKIFQLKIKVLVKTSKDIACICESIPLSWEREVGNRPHIIFLWDEINDPGILNQIQTGSVPDNVKYVLGAILWNVELKSWSKGTVYKFTNGKLSKQMTVRSINTVRKLNELMEKML
jgi:uncharacterized protein (DUF1697 family)